MTTDQFRHASNLPLPLRFFAWLMGLRSMNGHNWRFGWGEIGWRRATAAGLYLFADEDERGGCYKLHLAPIFCSVWIDLPFHTEREPDEMLESWSIALCQDSWAALHLSWGARYKIIYLPWQWEQMRHEVLRADGSWAAYLPHYFPDVIDEATMGDGHHVTTHPYRYVLASGEVQQVEAEIYVERRTRRWRWFGRHAHITWPRRTTTDINVNFSGEVGEGSGSYKGGTIGCVYAMLPGESGIDALRRMEAERKFR